MLSLLSTHLLNLIDCDADEVGVQQHVLPLPVALHQFGQHEGYLGLLGHRHRRVDCWALCGKSDM